VSLTREQLKKYWKEVEAFKSGSVIEWFDGHLGIWKVTENPSWSVKTIYRVRSETTIRYTTIYKEGLCGSSYTSLALCKNNAGNGALEILKLAIAEGVPIKYECVHNYLKCTEES